MDGRSVIVKYNGKIATLNNNILVYNYGPELISNGTFGSSTGWTCGTGISIHDGRLYIATTAAGNIFASIGATYGIVGKRYRTIMDVYDLSFGSGAQLYYGTGGDWVRIYNSGHINNAYHTFTAYYGAFWFYAKDVVTCSIDNISATRADR